MNLSAHRAGRTSAALRAGACLPGLIISRRWNLARLFIAAALLILVAFDSPARLARLQLAALSPMDYAGETRLLREQHRYAEALIVSEAGLADLDPTDPAHARVAAERATTLDEQSSWLRRATAVGRGALTGAGTSFEELLGAVTADFFVVGDVRDLAIQGYRYAVGDETDPLIAGLAAIGVATTLAPEIDWAPSILKAAKRAGGLAKELEHFLIAAIKSRRLAPVRALFEDLATVARRTSPATAARVLKHADNPADLARLARFAERAPGAPLALHVAAPEAVTLLRTADSQADAVITAAAKRGSAGAAFLRTPAALVLLKPHPIVGLLKGLTKGTLPELVARGLTRLDPYGLLVLPALAGWSLFEAGLFGSAWRRRVKDKTPGLPGASSHTTGDAPFMTGTQTGRRPSQTG